MRPRHRAAEYVQYESIIDQPIALASMRPRHRAAEYAAANYDLGQDDLGFNEAAA